MELEAASGVTESWCCCGGESSPGLAPYQIGRNLSMKSYFISETEALDSAALAEFVPQYLVALKTAGGRAFHTAKGKDRGVGRDTTRSCGHQRMGQR